MSLMEDFSLNLRNLETEKLRIFDNIYENVKKNFNCDYNYDYDDKL